MTNRTSTSLLRSPGVPGLLLAGVPGRLPMAAYGIGLLALGRGVYGSFSVGGMLAACYTAAAILSGSVIGARIDRPWFARRLPVLAGIHLALVAVMAVVASAAAPPTLVGLLSVVVGATVLPVGVITRASWTALIAVDDLGRA